MSKPKPTQSVQDAATFYTTKGWQVVPLKPGTKACIDDNWPKLVFKVEDFHPEDNIGIRSINGLVDVDCDAPEVVAVAPAFLPATFACYGRTSKPKSHWLYKSKFDKIIAFKDQSLPNDKNTLIEIRVNHQSMAPPSTHPSGEPVEWSGPLGDAAEVEPDELLRAVRLVATTAMVARHYNPPGDRHDWALALSGVFVQLGITEEEAKKILTEAGRWAKDSDIKDRMGAIRSTYGRADEESLKATKALKDSMPKGKQFVATLLRIWGGRAGSAFVLDAKGERVLKDSQENIIRALERLKVELQYDAFARRSVVHYNGYVGQLDDLIRNRLWLEIDKQFHFRPTADFFDVVLSDTATRHTVHPVQDYLDALKWDGKPRVDTWLINYGGAADFNYCREVAALVLIAAVRRVRQPGCKFDEVLVLESEQGMFKSSALMALCPNIEWFMDDFPLHSESKEIIERTNGKWIIEASELVGLSKRDSEHVKTLLSRPSDGPVRMAYGRFPVERPRQFVVIGTTNSHFYLKDETGNRRFWPIRCERFDVTAIKRDRDQLWAEANEREKRGESIRMREELYAVAKQQQERRRIEDPWEGALEAEFGDHTIRHRLTPDKIWEALHIPVERRDITSQTRVSAILQRLGFRRLAIRDGEKVVKGWAREANIEDLYERDKEAVATGGDLLSGSKGERNEG